MAIHYRTVYHKFGKKPLIFIKLLEKINLFLFWACFGASGERARPGEREVRSL
jgi:hypothetical protein